MRPDLAPAIAALNRVLLGKEHQIRLALSCLVAGGHLLLEDLPGMGKTTRTAWPISFSVSSRSPTKSPSSSTSSGMPFSRAWAGSIDSHSGVLMAPWRRAMPRITRSSKLSSTASPSHWERNGCHASRTVANTREGFFS